MKHFLFHRIFSDKVSKRGFLLGSSILFLLGIWLRFFKLNSIPVSLYYDEMDYAITGQALLQWGSDLSGSWSPLTLQPLRTLNFTAELPAVFHAVVLFFTDESAHLTSALFGLFTIFVIGFCLFRMTQRFDISFAVMTTVAINPWHIFISRMGYESVMSVFFQVIFLCCVWFLTNKKITKIQLIVTVFTSLVALFFSYFSYHGAKFTMIGLVVASTLWIFIRPFSVKKKVLLSSIFVITLGVLILHTWKGVQSGLFGQRDSELISLSYAANIVNDYRQHSVHFLGDSLFINKYTVLLKELSQRYLSVFDVYRLVGSGYESGFQFSLIVHGFFYLSSLLFLPLGVIWWWRRDRTFALYLLLMLSVSPMASVITVGYQSVFRSALTYVLLFVFVGSGMIFVNDWFSTRKFSLLFVLIFWTLLLTEVLYFGYSYLSRYPIVSANNHSFSEKLLATYVGRVGKPVSIVTDTYPYSKARSIIYYLHLLPELSKDERIQFSDPGATSFTFSRFSVSDECPELSSEISHAYVVSPEKFQSCHVAEYLATQSGILKNDQGQIVLPTLSSPIDSGAYWYLINDYLCDDKQLPQFVHVSDINVFDLFHLTDEEFCQQWVKVESK